MLGFDDMIEKDHLGILNNKEFAVECYNATTAKTFNVIKTDTFVEIAAEGFPITEEKPMFNTSMKHKDTDGSIINTEIKQFDKLTIEGITYIVRNIKKNGIGGIDIYLKG